MVCILCLGDSHIPNRAKSLPEPIIFQLNDLTKKKLFDYTLFTGDLIKYPELLEFLNLITKNDVFTVLGNMDFYYGNRNSPVYQELNVKLEDGNTISIGLTHGSQIKPRGNHTLLENFGIKKKNNIIISGHTHKEEVFLTEKGILLVNPGSVTGAWSFVASGLPTFITLSIDKSRKEIITNLYHVKKQSREISASTSTFRYRNNKIL